MSPQHNTARLTRDQPALYRYRQIVGNTIIKFVFLSTGKAYRHCSDIPLLSQRQYVSRAFLLYEH